MWTVLYIIYPNYQYYIDPDGTAYLTISRRYAEGHYVQAINGYWSPWSCWLTALLMKAGIAAIPASVIINTAGATGFLFITQSLFRRFDMIKKLQSFSHYGHRIINFEMETSALYGLGALMGHEMVTICALIANRATGQYNPDHKLVVNDLIALVLDHITR